MGILAGLTIFGLRDFFISLYNFDDGAQMMARQFITIISVSTVFTSFHAPCFVGIIRAGGDTKFVFIVDFLCSWLQVLPLVFVMAFVVHAPPWVVFMCIYSDQFYKWVIAFIKVNRFKWIKNLTRDRVV
jgi:Na+-driven multidrug efflux pump